VFPRRVVVSAIAGLEEAKNLAGQNRPPDSDLLDAAEFCKNLAFSSSTIAASGDRRFQFQKRSQLFIGVHNEPLSVVAMRVRKEKSRHL
jgi:hypothetical protein